MPLIQPVVGAAVSQPTLPATPWRPLRTLLRFVLGLLFVVASLVLTAWLTLHWGILPRIEQWRPQLEAQASRALGVPVRIGAIRATLEKRQAVLDTPQAQAEIHRGAMLSLAARVRFWSGVQDKIVRWRQPRNVHLRTPSRREGHNQANDEQWGVLGGTHVYECEL